MKYMQPVRKMIGKPTILNLVGPLINPYHLTYQMVGVFDPTKLKLVAKTIKDLGRNVQSFYMVQMVWMKQHYLVII